MKQCKRQTQDSHHHQQFTTLVRRCSVCPSVLVLVVRVASIAVDVDFRAAWCGVGLFVDLFTVLDTSAVDFCGTVRQFALDDYVGVQWVRAVILDTC